MEFSDEQKKSICFNLGNALISAGAGSGKTAVLTERIYRIAKKIGTLDTFLVLTFTELAAGEMKTRVRNKLLEDEETSYLASEVDDAHIETFDAFSSFVVKKYFYKLGISSDINILDNSIQDIQRKKFLDEVFLSHYEKEDKDFEKLIIEYCVRDEKEIKEFIIKLLQDADKKADNIAYLNELKKKSEDDSIVNLYFNDYIKILKERLKFIRDKILLLDDFYYEDYKIKTIDFIDERLKIDDYDLFRESNLGTFPSPGKSKNGQIPDEYKKEVNNLKDIYNKKIRFDKDNDFGDKKDNIEEFNRLAKFAKTIIDLALEVENKLSIFKKELNAYSFGDISRFVLHLLEDEEIRKELSLTFDYIMVDEYQDTNDIQETVINKIARNNVYMVGDVKQSIYRFRGADCVIFQNKYKDYQLNPSLGTKIDLNTSYRSRKEVVDFINDIFSKLMNKDINEIDYNNGHHFGFGNKKAYQNIIYKDNYQPVIYTSYYEKASQRVEKEARMIAIDLINKINNGFEVFDKDLQAKRKCSFKDFAIIIDRGTDFEEYAKYLGEYNIPVKIQNKDYLLQSDISYVTRSLVRILYYALKGEYEGEYHHAFYSLGRSFLFNYSDDYLYRLHKENQYLLDPLAQKIELIKESLRFSSIKDILIRLYEEFDVYNKIENIGNFYNNSHKLETFISLATSMDSLGYTVEDFVSYFEDLDNNDTDIETSTNEQREDSLTLINIHKSKGLEYPIIYFPGLSKDFNRESLNTSFQASTKYGVSTPNRTKKITLQLKLIKEEAIRGDFEEKLRLLYVAFTRAREKIIIIESKNKDEIKIKYPFDCRSNQDILNLVYEELEKYKQEFDYEFSTLKSDNKDKKINKIILKTIQIPTQIVKKSRASKEVEDSVDSSILSLGTELHMYLEKLDFENEQNFVGASKRMLKYITNVKNSVLFKGVKNDQIRHEFRFYDEENNLEGYIDALIIKDNEVDIIDFKFRNIDDEAYDRQLRTYKGYISKIIKLPIKMYLLSAVTGKYREVKDE